MQVPSQQPFWLWLRGVLRFASPLLRSMPDRRSLPDLFSRPV
jgi:hypothetical protein